MMHTCMSLSGSDCDGCKPYHCTLYEAVAVRVRGELCTDSLSLRALQDLPASNGASLSSNDIEKLKEMGRAEVGLVGC